LYLSWHHLSHTLKIAGHTKRRAFWDNGKGVN